MERWSSIQSGVLTPPLNGPEDASRMERWSSIQSGVLTLSFNKRSSEHGTCAPLSPCPPDQQPEPWQCEGGKHDPVWDEEHPFGR
jgi:hypothetical protein